ncbi:MAG: DUF2062 domain-containing protein [Gammaproteobacteria bacterium WSBS_2016_MAG_OTU1]
MKRFFRIILYYIRANERWLILKERANPGGFFTHMYSAGMLKFSEQTVCRGLAIGMFWGFVPIPFQMAPAAFFCWLARSNLPVAILCVWISNPLTYVPIFFLEYKVGVWLFGTTTVIDMEFFSNALADGIASIPLDVFQTILFPLLQGSVVVSIVAALVGYIFGIVLFIYIRMSGRIIRDRRYAKNKKAPDSH